MNVASPSYETMSKHDLIEIIETQQKVLAQFHRVLPLSNKVLAPGEKLAWIAAQQALAKEKPNEQGLVRLPIGEIAEQFGMSSGSGGRYFKNMCERFGATHAVEPYVTKKGQQCNLVWVDPEDSLWTTPETVELRPEQLRTINGNECPRCHSSTYRVKKRILTSQDIGTCETCNLLKVYPIVEENTPYEPGDYEPDPTPKGLQAGEPFAEPEPEPEQPETEKGSQAEEPFVEPEQETPEQKGSQAEDLFSPPSEPEKPQNLIELSVYTVGSIPSELRALRQWVCWRYEDSKKVPYIARSMRHQQRAKPNDPATWRAYSDAVALYERSRREGWKEPFNGIGFVFNGDYTGIDYDHCVEDGKVSEAAQASIDFVYSYAELSPSGTGVHQIVRGTVPAGLKRAGVEMYSKGRFFTFTGQHLTDTPATIEDCQEELDFLYKKLAGEASMPRHTPTVSTLPHPCTDEQVLEKARGAANGAKFTRLWEGDTTGYRSASEADLALCRMLAYYSDDDRAAIDRLFQRSGLHREKWERADYKQRTLDRALGESIAS